MIVNILIADREDKMKYQKIKLEERFGKENLYFAVRSEDIETRLRERKYDVFVIDPYESHKDINGAEKRTEFSKKIQIVSRLHRQGTAVIISNSAADYLAEFGIEINKSYAATIRKPYLHPELENKIEQLIR